ncbi:MAG: DUF2165 family protein [Rhodospirillales bacterium]|nr:DUF2165 family protein [Rhodospirillales bacterium]
MTARLVKLLAVGVLAAVAWALLRRDAAALAPPGGATALWRIGQGAMLAADALLALTLSVTALAMLRRLRGDGAAFTRTRRHLLRAALAGLALALGGTLAMAASYGDPWRAPLWAAPPQGLRFDLTLLLVLLFLNGPDSDLPRRPT